MSERDDTLSITLRFGSWTLPLTVPRAEEYVYRQAERLIKERFAFYSGNYPGQKSEMYLVMTVLDVAVKLKQREEADDASPAAERLEPLLRELEAALGGGAAGGRPDKDKP